MEYGVKLYEGTLKSKCKSTVQAMECCVTCNADRRRSLEYCVKLVQISRPHYPGYRVLCKMQWKSDARPQNTVLNWGTNCPGHGILSMNFYPDLVVFSLWAG